MPLVFLREVDISTPQPLSLETDSPLQVLVVLLRSVVISVVEPDWFPLPETQRLGLCIVHKGAYKLFQHYISALYASVANTVTFFPRRNPITSF